MQHLKVVSASLPNTDKAYCGCEVLRRNRNVHAMALPACSNSEVSLSAEDSYASELHRSKAGFEQLGFGTIQIHCPTEASFINFFPKFKTKSLLWVFGAMRTLSPNSWGTRVEAGHGAQLLYLMLTGQ